MKERTLSELIELSEMVNIAEELDGPELAAIATQVVEDHEANLKSMKDWKDFYDKGEKLIKPPKGTLSEPFEGASNFKSTLMQESAYRFAEPASTELMREESLAKGHIIGPTTPEKEKVSDRTSAYVSYQLNYAPEDWRDQQRDMLYQLPVVGCIVKKIFFDSIEGRISTELILPSSFSLNQSAKTQEDIIFTHILDINQNKAVAYQNAGIWLDEDLIFEESSDSDSKTDDTHDPVNCFLEQRGWLDLNDDGQEEPYIITLHKATNKIVRIVAAFEIQDIFVNDDDEIVRLSTLGTPKTDKFGVVVDDDGEPVLEFPDVPIVTIKRQDNLVFYGFLPALDGTFLPVGYYQLMAVMVTALNSIYNALINAGFLANMQGGYMAKNFEVTRGTAKFKAGQYIQTGLSPADLPNGLLPHMFKEPSQTLFELLQKTEDVLKSLSATVDMSEIIAANTSATTVLMGIEQAQSSTTSLMAAQARSMGKEFQIFFRLNRIYTDPEHYKLITGDPEADYAEDFSKENIRVRLTANIEMVSKFQRIQQGQILLDQWEHLEGVGANMIMVMRNYLKAIGIEEIDMLLPEPEKDTQQMMQEAAQAQKATSESQSKLFDAQSEALLAQAKKSTADADAVTKELPAKIRETIAKTLKLYEEAEAAVEGREINVEEVVRHLSQVEEYLATMEKLQAPQQGAQNAPPGNTQQMPAGPPQLSGPGNIPPAL